MIKQNIKAGLIQGITFSLVVGLIGVSYAVFNGFSGLEAQPNSQLSSEKWNNLVDAVKDEYKTDGSEVRTSKLWDGKPVYRKVITTTVNSDNSSTYSTLVNNNVERIFIEEVYVYVPVWNGHISMTSWQPGSYHLGASFNYGTQKINVYSNHSIVIGLQSEAVVEYTKTTDIAGVN